MNLKYLILTIWLITATQSIAQNGILRGVIKDKKLGEGLISATVGIEGNSQYLTVSDLDGNFSLEAPAGKYNIIITYIGYTTQKVTDVQLKPGLVTILDVMMEENDNLLSEIVIKANAINHNENAILALQRKATTIQDGISSQEISRNGSGNAAESMKRVTGASVVDGKFIFVRGLGDRYSSAQLNDLPLSGADPYRNSAPLDLIPSNMIDNIIASKTFTPDQSGNFTGGNINVQTKSLPERLTISAGISSTFNTQSSYQSGFMSYKGGKYDGLGYDDGGRALPQILQSEANRSVLDPTAYIKARKNDELASIIDQSTKALNSQMSPDVQRSGQNFGAHFSFGNQYKVAGQPLGVLLGVVYSKKFEFNDNGVNAYYLLNDPKATSLNLERQMTETYSVENPNLGGLIGLSYNITPKNKVKFNTIYNHDGEKTTRFYSGSYPSIISGGTFESRALLFKERGITTHQLTSENSVGDHGAKIIVSGALTKNFQNEPDLRFMANTFVYDEDQETNVYYISPSEYDLPFHFFRRLDDRQITGKIDVVLPLWKTSSNFNKIEFGAQYSDKNRNFEENRFQYQIKSANTDRFNGDVAQFFRPQNLGYLGKGSNGDNTFGLFVTNEYVKANNYKGNEQIGAAYVMGSIAIGDQWKWIGGVRAEYTDMSTVSQDINKPQGKIQKLDFLPSFNLIYALTDQSNLRGSWSQTLARPNMREMAPFSSFEFIGDYLFTGNPNIQRTLIQNYDLRYEWFPKVGEMIAVSGYYKHFSNPIIIKYIVEAANAELTYDNAADAMVFGAEVELRKNLDFIGFWARNFKIGANVSFIKSKVAIPEDEMTIINLYNPEKGNTRPFQGQSPVLINTSLIYTDKDLGIESALSFNYFGNRLSEVSLGGTPDVYEQARPQLDFTFRKSLTNHIQVKLSALNILNPYFKKSMHFNGDEFVINQFKRGTDLGFYIQYNL